MWTIKKSWFVSKRTDFCFGDFFRHMKQFTVNDLSEGWTWLGFWSPIKWEGCMKKSPTQIIWVHLTDTVDEKWCDSRGILAMCSSRMLRLRNWSRMSLKEGLSWSRKSLKEGLFFFFFVGEEASGAPGEVSEGDGPTAGEVRGSVEGPDVL